MLSERDQTGSANSGQTIAASDAKLNGVMRQAAAVLHLKPHIVIGADGRGVELCAAGDCEGHRSTDGSMYLLDL